MKTSVFLKMLGVVLASLLFSNCFFAKSNTESGESVLETNDPTAHTDSCGTSSVVCKSVGDTFAIELQSNPSTGYSWSCASDSLRYVELIERTFRQPERKGMMVGAGGADIWLYKAVADGCDTLNFKYKRRWENDSIPPKDSACIIVKIGSPQ